DLSHVWVLLVARDSVALSGVASGPVGDCGRILVVWVRLVGRGREQHGFVALVRKPGDDAITAIGPTLVIEVDDREAIGAIAKRGPKRVPATQASLEVFTTEAQGGPGLGGVERDRTIVVEVELAEPRALLAAVHADQRERFVDLGD